MIHCVKWFRWNLSVAIKMKCDLKAIRSRWQFRMNSEVFSCFVLCFGLFWFVSNFWIIQQDSRFSVAIKNGIVHKSNTWKQFTLDINWIWQCGNSGGNNTNDDDNDPKNRFSIAEMPFNCIRFDECWFKFNICYSCIHWNWLCGKACSRPIGHYIRCDSSVHCIFSR